MVRRVGRLVQKEASRWLQLEEPAAGKHQDCDGIEKKWHTVGFVH